MVTLFCFFYTLLSCRVGVVYSVKVLTAKRCAFVNYTKQEHCDEAIRRFHVSASFIVVLCRNSVVLFVKLQRGSRCCNLQDGSLAEIQEAGPL